MGKRARERARLEKQEAKRRRREATAEETPGPSAADEARLMEEFRLLSEQFAAAEVSEAVYNTERDRIFTELGIDP